MAKKYQDKDYVKEELNLTDKQLTKRKLKKDIYLKIGFLFAMLLMDKQQFIIISNL